jgi:phosphoserine phosphatase
VFADIRARGERSLVITMSPDFFARELLAVGADAVHGSRFPAPPYAGVAFDPSGILTPDDKPRLVAAALAAAAIAPERCVAFGDSMSDAPLFRTLAHTVAVNADDHLLDLAARTYRGEDLWAAYELGRSLLP